MTEPLNVKDALEIYASYRASIMTMWGFYSTATLGILGFTVGSDKVSHNLVTTRIIQIGYAIFALANMVAIATSQWELRAIARTIESKILPKELLGLSSSPIHPAFFVAFHLAIAAAVIYAIQLAYVKRKR